MTNFASGNGNGPNRSGRRRWLAVIGILGIGILLWLLGVNVFRQTAQPSAQRVTPPNPPETLNSADDYLTRGDYDFDLGNYNAAIADYSRAIELKPDYAEAYNNRAYAYMKMEKYALALPDLDRAIQLRPDYVNALMNRGDIYNYYYAIDYDRAVADYDRVLQLAPEHTSICGHRMLALHHGWSLSVIPELLTRGAESGCPRTSPAQ